MREVTVVTDGSCIGNPGPGGWACVLRCGEQQRELSGSDQETTSNRMELMAAIEGLRALKVPCRVRLVSDSQYLKKGITEFLPRWKANGWIKSKGLCTDSLIFCSFCATLGHGHAEESPT